MRLNEFAESARRFVWNELADWYLEASKGRLQGEGADRDVARAVLVHVFDQALRLLHPIVPFITEALWQRLPGRSPDEFLARAAWPRQGRADAERAAGFDLVREAVAAIRQVRSEYAIAPNKLVEVAIRPATPRAEALLGAESQTVSRLARATLTVAGHQESGGAAPVLLTDGSELFVSLAGVVDLEKECARVRGELSALEKQLAALEQRLGNEGFVSRAPAHVVQAERQKLGEWTARRAQLASRVQSLCG